jgi:hypothetical protein
MLLAACAVTESLHAYPVPGSQVSWSVLTAAVTAVVIVGDGCAELARAPTFDRARATAVGAAACMVVVLVVPFGLRGGVRPPADQFRSWLRAYVEGRHVRAPGTGPVRAPSWQVDLVDRIAPVVHRSCTTFVVLGADLSWYLLADRRPPTGLNQPAWASYLDDDEQRRTEAAFGRASRACLLLAPVGGRLLGDRLAVAFYIPQSRFVRTLERLRWDRLREFGGLTVLRRRDP